MASTLPTVADCCDPCVGSSSVTITGTVGWFVASSVSAGRGTGYASTNRFMSVGDGDGFFGLFVWDAASVLADDGLVVLNPTGNAGAGRWRKIL